jgi:hypothetical protein
VRYTRLDSSGLRISRIALGCMSFGDGTRAPWALDAAVVELTPEEVARLEQPYTPRSPTYF